MDCIRPILNRLIKAPVASEYRPSGSNSALMKNRGAWVLCGYGRMGREIRESLNAMGIRTVVIDPEVGPEEAIPVDNAEAPVLYRYIARHLLEVLLVAYLHW